ncbi:MAG: GHKL domain-containing protein [Clostridium sp.]|nr:GHKL domain-containing protein [Clostridium sp.]
MSEWIIGLYPYCDGIIEVLVGYYFYNRFLGKRQPFASYVLFAVVGVVISLICKTDSIVEFLAYITLFTLSGVLIKKANGLYALLCSVITIEVMHLCYGIIDSLLFSVLTMGLKINLQSISYIFMGIGSVLSLLLSMLCYVFIEKCFKSDGTDGRQYALMILTPTLLIFLVSEYISREIYGKTVTIDNSGKVMLCSNGLKILFIQLLGAASLFCILYAYKKIKESWELSKQFSLLEQNAHLLNQYVEEAKTRFEKTKAFRHDVKNHMTIIKELIQNGRTEATLQYMDDAELLMSDLSFSVNTNNPVLDILLANKLGLAASRKIHTRCSLSVPYPSKINDIDFCIVFSNALDNAISACERMEDDAQKFIHISGKVQGLFLMIEISNSYTGKKAVNRGTGIANIKAVTEKYQGAMDIKMDGKVFTLSVLFIIPQQLVGISQQTDEA